MQHRIAKELNVHVWELGEVPLRYQEQVMVIMAATAAAKAEIEKRAQR